MNVKPQTMESAKKFVAPTIQEIEDYIREKRSSEWPEKFIVYYAENFYNHYTAVGWRARGGLSIKDWKACFNNTWRVVKYEALDFLKQCQRDQPTKKVNSNPLNGSLFIELNCEVMNEVLRDYKKNYAKIAIEKLATYYNWLKERKLIILDKEEASDIKKMYNGNETEGKAACVRISFDKLITHNYKFK